MLRKTAAADRHGAGLERFYSFLALEMMTCYLDGYARSVNNRGGNRVEELRAQIRPDIAKLGTNALAQHNRAVAELQHRIGERVR